MTPSSPSSTSDFIFTVESLVRRKWPPKTRSLLPKGLSLPKEEDRGAEYSHGLREGCEGGRSREARAGGVIVRDESILSREQESVRFIVEDLLRVVVRQERRKCCKCDYHTGGLRDLWMGRLLGETHCLRSDRVTG